MFSGGVFKDKSCRKDVSSGVAFKHKSAGRMCLAEVLARRRHAGELSSGGAFKDKSCRKDVFSESACKEKSCRGGSV